MSVSKNKILYLHLADVQRGMGVPAMMEAGADKKKLKKTKTYKYYENIFSINYGWSDGCNVCLCARSSRLGML